MIKLFSISIFTILLFSTSSYGKDFFFIECKDTNLPTNDIRHYLTLKSEKTEIGSKVFLNSDWRDFIMTNIELTDHLVIVSIERDFFNGHITEIELSNQNYIDGINNNSFWVSITFNNISGVLLNYVETFIYINEEMVGGSSFNGSDCKYLPKKFWEKK